MTTWIANFDFDYRLAPTPNGQGVTLPQPVRERMRPLAGLFWLLADEGDTIATFDGKPPSVEGPPLPPVRFIRLAELGSAVHADSDAGPIVRWGDVRPDRIAVVRAANDKALLATLTREAPDRSGTAVPMRVFGPDDDAEQAIATLAAWCRSEGWWGLMLKARWSGFGRGCRRFFPDEQTDTLVGWVDRCRRRGGLVAEPLHRIQRQFSSHVVIEPGGIGFVGRIELHTDESGQPTNLSTVRDSDRGGIAGDLAVAEQVRRLGYLGPLSFDGYRHQWRDRVAFRAVSDINARLTLGSLALRIARRHGGRCLSGFCDGAVSLSTPAGDWVFRSGERTAER